MVITYFYASLWLKAVLGFGRRRTTLMKYDSRIFVNNGKAVIRCPACDRVKQVAVGQFQGEKHSLKVKCPCGTDFQVDLSFRNGIRKETDLKGTLFKNGEDSNSMKECRVVNLSYRGLRLHVDDGHNLQRDDEFDIKFSLENKQNTEVKRRARVRNTAGMDFLGCEFINPESDEYNKHICLFLMT